MPAGKTKTLSQFIEEANIVHNHKYDYSSSIYITALIKLEIKCNDHGSFWQSPNQHLSHKCGCPECGELKRAASRRYTQEEFLEKAKEIHGDKYIYDLVKYESSDNPIKIICPKENHGVFEQRPSAHMFGRGCTQCAIDTSSIRYSMTTEGFIEKGKIVHNNKYNYSKVIYTDAISDVIIICSNPKHGEFKQRAANHLFGQGCPECSEIERAKKRSLGLEEFIRRSKIIHNDSCDYSLIKEYKNNSIKVEILCKVDGHGSFWQQPANHLNGQKGCQICKYSNHKMQNEWLDTFKNPNIIRGHTMKINGRVIKPDGVDFTTNTIYEFYGDEYHGNPLVHNADKYSDYRYEYYGESYNRTIDRENRIKEAGYNLIAIWESEWKRKLKSKKLSEQIFNIIRKL